MEKKNGRRITTVIIVLILFFAAEAGALLEEFSRAGMEFNDAQAQSFLWASIGLVRSAFILMLVPAVCRLANKERLSLKTGKLLCLANSVLMYVLFNFIVAVNSLGWMLAIFYYFVNKWAFVEDENDFVVCEKKIDMEPSQLRSTDEKINTYGDYNVYGNDIALQTSSTPKKNSFCRKCGIELLDNSQFCHKCGTKAILDTLEVETLIKKTQITPIDKLAMLTVGLPVAIADKSEEEMRIVKNKYAYCEAVIFAEFFIRANVLEVAPSKDIAMKFSDAYIEAVIKETTNTVPDTEKFFADMFYTRATLYDNIVMNNKEAIMELIDVLTYIIHKELDEETYVTVDSKDFKYFGGMLENLAIKTELVGLFQCIHDCTADTMKELEEYLKTL